ncbi:hypothetical protein [Rossellomorea aquimaris]|uniref:hypothetical protein n=1 Tax=Rossellomorea aquimaris TaxID=189382 RepID=UPI0007D09DEC|nr:hypothetical protein [Rossellomorea aquimaris]
MKLSTIQWDKVKTYIIHHARPLEQNLFAYLFESGAKENVITELARFQNSDGGFGQSIEPDFRLTISSPLATTIGLQIAKTIDLSKNHQIVINAMNYLSQTYDEKLRGWNAVPPEVNDVPHAPWWHFDHDQGHCGVQSTWANPNAEIVGYFHYYQPEEPRLKSWTQTALTELKDLSFPYGMHDFLCYQRLLDCITGDLRQSILDLLSLSVRNTVCTDPNQWNEYVAKPLQFASSPTSPFYPLLKEEVELQLNVEIQNVHEDGYWQPNWSWFGQYNETWEIAEKEWRGIVTLEMLRVLNRFDKIALRDN